MGLKQGPAYEPLMAMMREVNRLFEMNGAWSKEEEQGRLDNPGGRNSFRVIMGCWSSSEMKFLPALVKISGPFSPCSDEQAAERAKRAVVGVIRERWPHKDKIDVVYCPEDERLLGGYTGAL